MCPERLHPVSARIGFVPDKKGLAYKVIRGRLVRGVHYAPKLTAQQIKQRLHRLLKTCA
jgi:hypothetical protein